MSQLNSFHFTGVIYVGMECLVAIMYYLSELHGSRFDPKPKIVRESGLNEAIKGVCILK